MSDATNDTNKVIDNTSDHRGRSTWAQILDQKRIQLAQRKLDKTAEKRRKNLERAQNFKGARSKRKPGWMEESIVALMLALMELSRKFVNFVLRMFGIKAQIPSFVRREENLSGYNEAANAAELENEYERSDKNEFEENVTKQPDLAKRVTVMKRYLKGDAEEKEQVRSNFANPNLCSWLDTFKPEEKDKFVLAESTKIRKHLAGVRKVDGIPSFDMNVNYADRNAVARKNRQDGKQMPSSDREIMKNEFDRKMHGKIANFITRGEGDPDRLGRFGPFVRALPEAQQKVYLQYLDGDPEALFDHFRKRKQLPGLTAYNSCVDYTKYEPRNVTTEEIQNAAGKPVFKKENDIDHTPDV